MLFRSIDLFSPRFNRVPPGVDDHIFFPYTRAEHQTDPDRTRVQKLLFEQEDDERIFGSLDQPDKRPILAVASIDPIKNLTGLVECFGRSPELQESCNLILLANAVDVNDTMNSDATQEMLKLHALIEQYGLQGKIRWLGVRLQNSDRGTVYRLMADRQGLFIHFAQFESFGRTILEAMISGLPSFATQFGGGAEIIQDGDNGFHINPTDFDGTAQKILKFLYRCDSDPAYWKTISDRSIQHIQAQYDWPTHAQQILLLTKIYSFWHYTEPDRQTALQRYLEALFYLLYKPRADVILEAHMHRS